MGYNRSIRMAINKGFGAAPEASSTKTSIRMASKTFESPLIHP